MTPNQIMKLRGFDVNQTNCELKRDQPFSFPTTGKHTGMPISARSFLEMTKRFVNQNPGGSDNPFRDLQWVTFSKASIFRVLAQEDCEYVRFYFAIPEEGTNKASLALQGLDRDFKPVKLEQILKVAATMTPKDGGVDADSDGQDITIMTGTPPPNNEEKGNGGPPVVGDMENISSFKEWVNKNEKDLADKPFGEVMKEFYEFAQKKDDPLSLM